MLLTTLYPFVEGKGENNDSLVLLAEIKDRRFLFTGDLEKEGEEELVRRYPNLTVDYLKVGHHGSKTSSGSHFLKQIGATEALISCGQNNRFSHPHMETLQNLKKQHLSVYRTDLQGMIYYEWLYGYPKLFSFNVVKK